jgi:protease-4
VLDDALMSGGANTVPLRAAIMALHAAADDDRISGVLLRGTINADNYGSGYAALREFRAAIADFRRSKKPVHAFLLNPQTRDYYVASAASVITMDPFGSLMMPGMASEQVFFAGLFEKYGIGVQVSRVGKFKAAVEPFTRTSMSPENRLQTQSYLGDMWREVKRGIADSRRVDTTALQALVDAQGIILPADAKTAGLVDRIAYFDEVLTELMRIARVTPTGDSAGGKTAASGTDSRTNDLLDLPKLPQIALEDYAPVAMAKEQIIGASQAVAIVYAEGDIVDGQGNSGQIGGDGLARELRRIRNDAKVKAVVLRVNSPGGSAVASERIQRELVLTAKTKPVVVSMGTVAASGGYWISTAAARIFAEPNTITGSIGVFSISPNIAGLAKNNGVTFDTVKTGRYADIFSIARPRSADEMAVLQRGTDAVYNAFIERVATARKLTPDSVRAIAEGRVWSGSEAMRIGLVDSIGGLDVAVKSAAKLAKITGDYEVREFPRVKSTTDLLSEMFERRSAPVSRVAQEAATAQLLRGTDPAHVLARDLAREMNLLLSYNDPRGVYARMPFVLRVR